MERTPEIQKFVDGLTEKMFGRKITKSACVTCGNTQVTKIDFKDDPSWKEFDISGMCQKCQDSVFEI